MSSKIQTKHGWIILRCRNHCVLRDLYVNMIVPSYDKKISVWFWILKKPVMQQKKTTDTQIATWDGRYSPPFCRVITCIDFQNESEGVNVYMAIKHQSNYCYVIGIQIWHFSLSKNEHLISVWLFFALGFEIDPKFSPASRWFVSLRFVKMWDSWILDWAGYHGVRIDCGS